MTFIFFEKRPINYSDARRHGYAGRREPLFVACFLFFERKSKKIMKFSETPLKMLFYGL